MKIKQDENRGTQQKCQGERCGKPNLCEWREYNIVKTLCRDQKLRWENFPTLQLIAMHSNQLAFMKDWKELR